MMTPSAVWGRYTDLVIWLRQTRPTAQDDRHFAVECWEPVWRAATALLDFEFPRSFDCGLASHDLSLLADSVGYDPNLDRWRDS